MKGGRQMKALYFTKFGGPEVLEYGEISDPVIDSDSALVETSLIGLNFADIYRRRGNYHIENHTPWINGYEGIGRVIKLGENANSLKVGDRILFVDVPYANAEFVSVPTKKAIIVPDSVSDELAISLGLQGLTADFLAHDLAKNSAEDKVLIHGISGGVGQILTQILVSDGTQVFGVASTFDKQQIALRNGAKKVFDRNEVLNKKLFGSFDTVFDGTGSTLETSFKLIKHRGKVVFFGMAGGNPSKIDPVSLLSESKSLLTGDLWDYLTTQPSRQMRFNRLLKYVLAGDLDLAKPKVYALSAGYEAHRLMESGKSVGKIVLKP